MAKPTKSSRQKSETQEKKFSPYPTAPAELADSTLVFSGTAHPALAQEIAAHLGLEVSPSVVRKFSNDNLYVQLGVSVRGKHTFIIQPISPPASDNLMELLLMLDAARGAGAAAVHAVIPYFSYARSDKKDAPRISIAGRLVADLVHTAGANRVMTMTLHAAQVHGFFSVPTDHLTARSAFVRYFSQQDLTNTVVVSPDIGNAKRALELARALGVTVAAGEKTRLADDSVEITSVLGDVAGKRAIILDDEIATGGTIVETVRVLRKQNVRRITLVCTHGLFTGSAVERFNQIEEIEEIVTTNTVPLLPQNRPERLRVLSVADIFGEVIRRNVLGESVGALFEYWKTFGK